MVCFAVRCMDLIPRAGHEVGRMRLSMKLAHLVRGGNLSAKSRYLDKRRLGVNARLTGASPAACSSIKHF